MINEHHSGIHSWVVPLNSTQPFILHRCRPGLLQNRKTNWSSQLPPPSGAVERCYQADVGADVECAVVVQGQMWDVAAMFPMILKDCQGQSDNWVKYCSFLKSHKPLKICLSLSQFSLRFSYSGDVPSGTVFLLVARHSQGFGFDQVHHLVSWAAEPLHFHSRKMSVSLDRSSALQAL